MPDRKCVHNEFRYGINVSVAHCVQNVDEDLRLDVNINRL